MAPVQPQPEPIRIHSHTAVPQVLYTTVRDVRFLILVFGDEREEVGDDRVWVA